MRMAIAEASQGDLPFGAVIVGNKKVLEVGRNLGKTTNDPTAHAEMVAIRRFVATRDASELKGTTLYSSGGYPARCAWAPFCGAASAAWCSAPRSSSSPRRSNRSCLPTGRWRKLRPLLKSPSPAACSPPRRWPCFQSKRRRRGLLNPCRPTMPDRDKTRHPLSRCPGRVGARLRRPIACHQSLFRPPARGRRQGARSQPCIRTRRVPHAGGQASVTSRPIRGDQFIGSGRPAIMLGEIQLMPLKHVDAEMTGFPSAADKRNGLD